jgi:hypothetical protein
MPCGAQIRGTQNVTHAHARPDSAAWLDSEQLATYFGISRRSVDRKAASGEWPSRQLPGITGRRFSPADVRAIEGASAYQVSA